jgi:aspartate-semialdehyde dehydrogenase
MNPDVPLVVPEINASALADHQGIIANPNCAAIIAITPLWPIHRRNRIRRLLIATYQAASGAGAAAMNELVAATRAHLAGDAFAPRALLHPCAFNLFSHDTAIDPASGFNEEEIKVINETRKSSPTPTSVSASPVSACRCCAPMRRC